MGMDKHEQDLAPNMDNKDTEPLEGNPVIDPGLSMGVAAKFRSYQDAREGGIGHDAAMLTAALIQVGHAQDEKEALKSFWEIFDGLNNRG